MAGGRQSSIFRAATTLTLFVGAVLFFVHLQLGVARRRVDLRRRIRAALERGVAPEGGWLATVDLESGKLVATSGTKPPLRTLQYIPAATRGDTVLARVRERASAGGGWLDIPGSTPHAAYVGSVGPTSTTAPIAGRAE